MDVNDLRSIVTVVLLVMFLVIVAWTYSKKRAAGFDECAALPLHDDEPAAGKAVAARSKQ
jgi:cytochrome c oxidase cbb3-type subunit 4